MGERIAHIKFSDEERRLLDRYHALIVDWNERMNLTGITDYNEVYVKHFADSVAIAEVPAWQALFRDGMRVLDLGTGAGFPGIPLAIRYPQFRFVLCDALQKRLTFLHAVVDELGLQNVQLIHGRAEDLGRDRTLRSQFDAVTSRAVARLNVLVELMCPFLRVGGAAFAYKGPQVVDEWNDGSRAASRLGAELIGRESYALPDDAGAHNIVVIRQVQPAPAAYPRRAGTPKKQPL